MQRAEEFRRLFTELYNAGEPILNQTTNEVFEPDPDEVFRQCWADTITRRNFPRFWFVSEKGNLLSVKKDRIQWLNKNKRDNSNKISYKFMVETPDGTRVRNVEEHNLVGLVWGSEAFGTAAELLESQGLDAFGINSKEEDHVQGHHISHDDTDNTPGNIKFLTDKVHTILEKAPRYDAPEEKHLDYMVDLGKVMDKENPNAITVVFTGDVYNKQTGTWSNTGESDVFSTNKITLSPKAAMQLQSIMKLLA